MAWHYKLVLAVTVLNSTKSSLKQNATKTDCEGTVHGLSVENREVDRTSPSSLASLQLPTAPQIKLNRRHVTVPHCKPSAN